MAMFEPLVSVLINNYNYGRYVGAAIESALNQHYPRIEVVVVDDGSTDDSRRIIDSYHSRICSVFKQNGGQGSAFNAGAAEATGDILCFLDADDLFHSDKVNRVVSLFRAQGLNSKPMMIHHQWLSFKDLEDGKRNEQKYGNAHTSPLNLYEFAKRHRYLPYKAGPTSVLSINRSLASRLFPIPEKGIRIAADDFLVYGASLLGDLYSISEPLTSYRVHGENRWLYSGRRKSPEFLMALESYLNVKLSDSGLLPVISFKDSIAVWPQLLEDRRYTKLLVHILRILARDRDLYTSKEAYRYFGRACKNILRRAGAGFLTSANSTGR
jgi:glycosyltransferase involved in cell wall biosynthesis